MLSALPTGVFSMNERAPRPANDAIVYPFAQEPAAGVAAGVATGTFWLRMPLPFVLNHINLWLLEDDGGWCIVDTGLDTGQIRDLWKALHGGFMAGRPVTRVIVTHYHPDHLGLAAWLMEQFGCEVWMTEPEQQMAMRAIREDDIDRNPARLAFFRRHGLTGEPLNQLESWGGSYRRGVSGVPARFVRLHDQARLRIGAHEWTVVTGRGHSPEHATLYCPALGVLLAGDHVLPTITPHIGIWHFDADADPVRCYLASFARFRELPADTLVLPAHGAPFTGLHARLDMLAHHHAQRLEAISRACEQPRSAAQLLGSLFGRRLNSHQVYFAMGEAIAHLNYLHYAGSLVRTTDIHDTCLYRRA